MFLFTELLVLTRPVTRNERHCFQVYRQPIPVQDLVLEDLQDGDVRMGGSFRGAFGNADKGEDGVKFFMFYLINVSVIEYLSVQDKILCLVLISDI